MSHCTVYAITNQICDDVFLTNLWETLHYQVSDMKRLPNHKGSISNSLCVFTVHNTDLVIAESRLYVKGKSTPGGAAL